MNGKITTVCLALALALVSIAPAGAHHSSSYIDTSRSVEVKGVLRSVDFINPHSELRLDATDAKGKQVSWVFESNPPGWFRSAGIKKADFAKGIGQEVTITASPSKDGSPHGALRKVTFSDGTFISMSFGN